MIFSQGVSINSNLRLQGYISPSGMTGNRHLFEKRPTNVSVDCAEKLSLESIQKNDRTLSDAKRQIAVHPSDCPLGYYPIYSRATDTCVSADQEYCSVVQMCTPCTPGFFSAEMNTQCQICPVSSTSAAGAFGIRGCNCKEGEFIEYWKYSSSMYIPPATPSMSRDMKC